MNNPKSIVSYLGQAIDDYRADRKVNATHAQTVKTSGHFLRWLMPNGGTLLLVIVLILTQQVWAMPFAPATTAGPSATTVNYQGRLADDAGTPLDGTYGMTFALYDAPTGGNLVWGPESHTSVPVSDGLFSVGLGSQTSGGIPTTTWNGDRYLEITVAGETLSPRELIRSVPIAGMALTVPDGAITPAKAPQLVSAPTDNVKIAYVQAVVTKSPSRPDTGHLTISVVPYGFTQTPTALCGLAGNSGFNWSCHVEYEDTKDFTIWVIRRDGRTDWSSVPVRWTAIGN